MFKHIENKICTDSGVTNLTYYKGKDIMGRNWVITQFSLAGIWIMRWRNMKIFVNSLFDADILLGGGTIHVNKMEKGYVDDAMQEYTNKQIIRKTSKRW